MPRVRLWIGGGVLDINSLRPTLRSPASWPRAFSFPLTKRCHACHSVETCTSKSRRKLARPLELIRVRYPVDESLRVDKIGVAFAKEDPKEKIILAVHVSTSS